MCLGGRPKVPLTAGVCTTPPRHHRPSIPQLPPPRVAVAAVVAVAWAGALAPAAARRLMRTWTACAAGPPCPRSSVAWAGTARCPSPHQQRRCCSRDSRRNRSRLLAPWPERRSCALKTATPAGRPRPRATQHTHNRHKKYRCCTRNDRSAYLQVRDGCATSRRSRREGLATEGAWPYKQTRHAALEARMDGGAAVVVAPRHTSGVVSH